MRYYGIEYRDHQSCKGCTSGEPNTQTGRMSVACHVLEFTSKVKRDSWVNEKHYRISATKKTIREHCLGDSVAMFEQWVTCLQII